MAVRRGAARLGAVVVLLGGLLAVSATPALAAEDSVKVRVASSFKAGGSPGSVAIEVRKRTEGCVLVRTALRLRLSKVRADQVEVQVSAGGQWWPVSVSGSGVVTTAQTPPANPTLCKGKSLTVRYRVTFLPGAPAGELTVAGVVTTATGKSVGRDSGTSEVRAGRTPTPSPKPTKSPTPTPTPVEVTIEPTVGPAMQPTVAAVSGAGGGKAQDAGGGSGGGISMVMVFGLGLVAAGLGLIALLFRRSRRDRGDADQELSGRDAASWSGSSGGTTYRSRGTVYPSSGARYPEPRSGRSGTVYPASGSGHPGTYPPPSAPGAGDSTTVMPRLPD